MHFNFWKKIPRLMVLLIPSIAVLSIFAVVKLTLVSAAVPNPGHNYAEVEFPTGVVFTESGNVGIGTASPTSGTKLDVRGRLGAYNSDSAYKNAATGGIQLYDGAPRYGIYFTNGHTDSTALTPYGYVDAQSVFSSPYATVFRSDNNWNWIWSASADTVAGVNIMELDSSDGRLYVSGNVGIGTTIPGAKLTVIGSNTPSPTLSLRQYNDATDGFDFDLETDVVGRLDLYRVVDGTRNQVLSVLRGTGNVGIGTASPQGKLEISGGGVRLAPTTQPDSLNGMIYYDSTTNKFRCYENGAWADCIGAVGASSGWTDDGTTVRLTTSTDNVGIGTSSPATKLHVEGSSPAIIARNTGGAELLLQAWGTTDVIVGSNTGSASLQLWSGASEKMRITTGGNVGIGTTNPSAKLDVSGSIEYTSKPWLRFTRTSVSSSSSDAIKDSQCSSEFGSAYVAANARDVAALRGGVANPTVYFNVAGNSDSWFVWYSSYGYIFMTIAATGDTYSVACVQKYAPLRFTRVSVSNSALDSTKDTQCSTEFGSNYQAAVVNDVDALWGTTALGLGFVVAGDTTRLWSVTGGTNAALIFTYICCGTASDSLACVHK